MAGSVPSVGDKQRLVGPVAEIPPPVDAFRLRADADPYLTGDVTLASGTFITLNQVGQTITINCDLSPAVAAPPEVRQTSELGVSSLFALADHTHQSPTIYWPQSGSPNDNVVSNRSAYITRTTSTQGATNFCSYPVGSIVDGAQGDFATIGGGYECSAVDNYSVVSGGFQNACLTTLTDGCNTISGGASNTTVGCSYCSIAGGVGNNITQFDDPTEEVLHAHCSGSYGEVYRSGGSTAGVRARSYMAGEQAYACGSQADQPGYAQDSRVVISGRTPGSVANESVQLVQWTGAVTNGLLFQPDRAFTAELRVVAADTASANQASWVIGVSFRTNGAGVVSILSSSSIYSYQSAGSVLWNVVLTAVADELIVTFFTGAGVTAAVNVTAALLFTQVINAPF